jgi:SAM-dependent methyltransferase
MRGRVRFSAAVGKTFCMPEAHEAVLTVDPVLTDRPAGPAPGDTSLVERCQGPTLDVGSGPGRLTVALAERGIPALGIDVTPDAVQLARSAGALTLLRDVFGRVPGAGRWRTVLLTDGAIGIGGDPAALLRRIGDLLGPQGRALVEVQPPGEDGAADDQDRGPAATAYGLPWASVGADQIGDVARSAGLVLQELWTASGRWFAALDGDRVPVTSAPVSTGTGPCASDGPGWPATPEPG